MKIKKNVFGYAETLGDEIGIYIVCDDSNLLLAINQMMRSHGLIAIGDTAGRQHYIIDGRKSHGKAAKKLQDLIFNDRKQSLLDDFNTVNEVLPIWKVTGEDVRFLISLRHQTFIRHQFFEGKIDYMKRLPYRYIGEFADKLKTSDEESLKKTMIDLSRAISISEGCDATALTDGYLLLSNSQVGDPLSKSYRRFSIDEFELFVNKTDHLTEYIEYESDSFTFRHKTDKFIQLTVSLDLYEMLQYISSGFNPSVSSFAPFRITNIPLPSFPFFSGPSATADNPPRWQDQRRIP